MQRSTSRAGYTLIELLLAMSLFAALSTGLIALLARSSEFLASGASQTETMDSIQTFAEAFGSDVRTLSSRSDCDQRTDGRPPDVRMYSDWANCDINGDHKPDVMIPRLFFVKTISNDLGSPEGQASGLDVGASEYLDQFDDEKNKSAHKLRASGGEMEVFWTAMPDSIDDLAVMKIWRGYRSPPGGPKSLLPLKTPSDPSATALERGPIDAVDVRHVAKPVLSGVLYFGVDFWSRRTTTWDAKIRAKDGGPLPTWDSTRGIMMPGDAADSFQYAKRRTSQDSSSLTDATDDTFPRKIRVTCVVEELGRNARVGYLTEDMPADMKSVSVADTRFFPLADTKQRFVKIDGEWMEVGLPDRGAIPVVHRGVRGTAATPHKAGAMVHHGRTFVQEYDVATFRDSYRDDLPAISGSAR